MAPCRWALWGFIALAGAPASAQERPQKAIGYSDTPMLPGTRWHVHDGQRPQPRVVEPGAFRAAVPPSDAVVLFDGRDLSAWRSESGAPSGWVLADGAMIVPARGVPGGGDAFTRQEFGDFQLHLEWATPETPVGDGQERGNSGVYLMGLYELQVLDSYQNPTYPDGQAGAIYGQFPPLVNASRKPGEWQSYDVTFTAPRFADGKVVSPAYLTAFQNGVLIQDHVALLGATGHRVVGTYKPHPAQGPLRLQDHGNPVRYRNVWIRPLRSDDRS